ncbi:S8 family serine peptidase [Lentzea aerocolonigenes]|uniref:S8 family serine peptidase n=1 Tax=Lentzea aerocolonigenes TaxID=68170 RepID=UPI00068E2A3D|nr:S8 family serine peptidase [Lentzea aerocolonigenes]MCP2248489.1 serine protease [Lentzea aerocolonigenes]
MRTGLAALLGAVMALAVVPLTAAAQEEPEQEIIVKFREGASRADALEKSRTRAVADATDGAEVLASRDAAESIRVLMARGDVEYAEPNIVLETMAPNDPLWPSQWHYWESPGGIDLPLAWGLGPSGLGQRVAVIDTGRTAHPDLSANYIGGYDFISNAGFAKDGNGRDANPTDQGDWQLAGQCGPGVPARPSSWHGLHVAGTVAALRNNATGGTGVAPLAKVVPVRVLGTCGGTLADIAAGIVWAAGGAVPGVPANPNPARTLNLSLGGPSAACPVTLQNAINTARNALGATVVVAAGNAAANASGTTPANCVGVITTGATDRSANRASYSNFGATVEICAPGGETSPVVANGVLSTLNNGPTVPAASIYKHYQGTSMATPHVAGVVALMQHARVQNGKALLTPAQVLLHLKAKVMPPAAQCGKGLLDARASVQAAIAAP